MKTIRFLVILMLLLGLNGTAQAGKGTGYGGGTTTPTIQPTTQPDTGELYGDLYVILRNVDGVPMLDSYGCIQPIASDGTVLQLYTSVVDDIYCEVTADLAMLVQTVDFGRLNLGRAPDGVIAHAFDEAVNSMNSATEMGIDPAGRLSLLLDGEWKTIDAPAENLALYIKMMTDGHWITVDTTPIVRGGQTEVEERPVLNDTAKTLLANLGYGILTIVPDPALNLKADQILTTNELQLAASLLAAAADKTGSINLDKLIYINSIYGINQKGSLPGEIEGKTYFNFGAFDYNRAIFNGRSSGGCGSGSVWVLQPVPDSTMWEQVCMEIQPWIFKGATASGGNIRGYSQASDDALTVIEYIHNYEVPAILP